MVSVLILTTSLLALATCNRAAILTVTSRPGTQELCVVRFKEGIAYKQGNYVIFTGEKEDMIELLRNKKEKLLRYTTNLTEIKELLSNYDDFIYTLTDCEEQGTYKRVMVTGTEVAGTSLAWMNFTLVKL